MDRTKVLKPRLSNFMILGGSASGRKFACKKWCQEVCIQEGVGVLRRVLHYEYLKSKLLAICFL